MLGECGCEVRPGLDLRFPHPAVWCRAGAPLFRLFTRISLCGSAWKPSLFCNFTILWSFQFIVQHVSGENLFNAVHFLLNRMQFVQNSAACLLTHGRKSNRLGKLSFMESSKKFYSLLTKLSTDFRPNIGLTFFFPTLQLQHWDHRAPTIGLSLTSATQPSVWRHLLSGKHLPHVLGEVLSLNVSKPQLKAHLFQEFYNVSIST